MAGFGNSCPKTPALNLAPAAAILLQFKKFQNRVNNPLFCEPWK
jgi:hypothetical protein